MFERGLAYRKRSTRQLVSERQHGARERAGGRRRVLALRHDGRARAISSSGSFGSPPTPTSCSTGLDTLDGVARESRRDAAELDRALRRRPARVSGCRAADAGSRSSRPASTRSYGATFVLLAPEHPLVERFAAESADPAAFRGARRGVSRARSRRRGSPAPSKRKASTPAARPSIRSPARRCRSGSRTSCWPNTAPAPSWRCRRTTSATSSSRANTACRSASSSAAETTRVRRDD